MIRCTGMDITFRHAFVLKGLEVRCPPGTYRVDIEEEPIDGLSFLAYRRLATFIRVPVAGRGGTDREPADRSEGAGRALERDSAAQAATV